MVFALAAREFKIAVLGLPTPSSWCHIWSSLAALRTSGTSGTVSPIPSFVTQLVQHLLFALTVQDGCIR